MDVGFAPSQPDSRFFNREFEKTPSPEKEEVSRVLVDYRVLASSANPIFFPGMVVDFSYLNDKYAAVEIEDPWVGAVDKNLPDLAVDRAGNVMQLVDRDYIRVLLKSPPSSKPLPDYSIEALRGRGIRDADQLEMLSSSGKILQRQRDSQMDIIQQYRNKGYAYVALPVTSERYPANPRDLPPLP